MYDHFTVSALLEYKRHLGELIVEERDKQSKFYFSLIEQHNNVSKEICYRIKRGFIFHER